MVDCFLIDYVYVALMFRKLQNSFGIILLVQELNYFSYLKAMNLPEEAYDIFIYIAVIGVGMALVAYFTRKSRNFRSSRNKRARKQF
jgi:hypothetical protein